MDSHVLEKAVKLSKIGQDYCIATVTETTPKGTPRKSGAKMVVLADGSSFGTIGGGRNEKAAIKECIKSLKTGTPKTVEYNYFGQKGQSVCGGQIKVFIDPFLQSEELIICGGGHIGLSLSFLAKMLHFDITIIDNRKEYCSSTRFPHANKLICGQYNQALRKLNITKNTYIMIVTQGNEHDFKCLKEVYNSNAAYIGVISSKAKKIKFFNRLKKEEKISEKQLSKIDIPAGINLGAQTPDEIGVSIASKLIKIRQKRNLKSSKFKAKT